MMIKRLFFSVALATAGISAWGQVAEDIPATAADPSVATAVDSSVVTPADSSVATPAAPLVATPAVRPLTIGYLSYDSVLVTMPDYAEAMDSLATERNALEQEMKRVEDEFNAKYEDFLENREDFPRTILLKRQNELQDLLQTNIAFREQCRRDLQQREQALLARLRLRLRDVVTAVARDLGLALVVNTDADACPFIDPALSIDLTALVIDRLSQ